MRHLMLACAAVACATVVWAPCAAQVAPSTDDRLPARLGDLLEHAAELRDACAAYRTTVRMETFAQRVLSLEAARRPETWTGADAGAAVTDERATWASWGRLRALTVRPWTADDAPALQPSFRMARYLWTGTEWHEHVETERGAEYLIRNRPRASASWEFLALFNGGVEWPSFVSPLGLRHSIEAFRPLDVRVSGDERTFVLAWRDDAVAPRVLITLAMSPRPHLRSIAMELMQTTPAGPAPYAMKELRFTEWSRAGDVMVPQAALYVEGEVAAGTPATIYATRVTRIDEAPAAAGDVAEIFAHPPLRAGTVVRDDCYGLRYEIGGHRLQISDVGETKLRDPIVDRLTGPIAQRVDADLRPDVPEPAQSRAEPPE